MGKQLTRWSPRAGSGICRATALELADRGHLRWRSHVAPTSSKSGRGSESRLVPLPLDVTDLETVGAAARRVGEPAGGGGVEVLVNAAD